MSARARAKGREGTKTNKGALFARINDVVDIEQAMRKEEVLFILFCFVFNLIIFF